jgi:hypothetical protein
VDTPAVYPWKLQGRLHIWQYLPSIKGLKGWHLNADATACASLIDLADRMLASEEKSYMRIPVHMPANMLVGRGHSWKPVSELCIRYPRSEVDDEFWYIELDPQNVLTLIVGKAKLWEFRESLLGLPNWKDYFAIGPVSNPKRRHNSAERARFDAECLWFWTKVE